MIAIRTEIYHPAVGFKAIESEDCPFKFNGRCKIVFNECDFGLTSIDVPVYCPMRNGTLTIKSKRVDIEDSVK